MVLLLWVKDKQKIKEAQVSNKSFAELAESLLKLKKAVEDDFPSDGYSIVDNPDDAYNDDEASQWLKEQQKAAPAEKKSSYASSKKWQPEELNAEQQKAVMDALKSGHSQKEAHWLAGKKVHDTKAEMPSKKVLDIMKDVAKKHMSDAAYNSRIEASESINPAKYAEGRRIDAFAHHTDDYKDKYHNALNDPSITHKEVKDEDGNVTQQKLSPKERHASIQAWKSQNKKDDYHNDIRDTLEGETHTGAAQRKVTPLNEEQKKWFDYAIKEHMPEINKNINYLRAKGYVPSSIDHNDLISHGVNGLMDAFSKYDHDVANRTYKEGSNPFVKYAAPVMRGKMLEFMKQERGPKGDVGAGGMSTAEAAQHLGIQSEEEGQLPGMSIKGGGGSAPRSHKYLSSEQLQRKQNVDAAKNIAPTTKVRKPKGE
jgi:hypothetical protein